MFSVVVLLMFISNFNVDHCYGSEDNVNGSNQKPNIVLFLTDDQDLLLDGLIPMRTTLNEIANKGATFTNYFVNSPICCPSRSTILTGVYSHNTGVRNNSVEGNCSSAAWQQHYEPSTIAPLLKRHGYGTFYAGKYLNRYEGERVPPGYDWWVGLEGNSKYYNYTLNINGTRYFYGDYYLTDVVGEWALQFLTNVHSTPFLMIVAPPAPHAPFTPADRHKTKFRDAQLVQSPAFNHSTANKHWIVQMAPKFLPNNIDRLTEIHQNRLRTLLSVDEMVGRIVDKLEMLSILNNTYLIFTSDNGYHIGQFTQPWDKRQPYETDIRVPFFIRGPNILPKIQITNAVSTVDLAPTMLDLAVGDHYDMFDGQSFKNELFSNNNDTSTRYILIEYWGEFGKSVDEKCHLNGNVAQCSVENWCKCEDSINNTYSCVVKLSEMEHWKFCQFEDDFDFVEVYNLRDDPYELDNVYKQIPKETYREFSNILNKLNKCRGSSCFIISNSNFI